MKLVGHALRYYGDLAKTSFPTRKELNRLELVSQVIKLDIQPHEY